MANMMNLGLMIVISLSTLKVRHTHGFYKHNSTTEESNNSDCGGAFNETQFFLMSPKYPDNYPSNLNCDFYLQGPECPTHYKLDFLDFKLEKSVGCAKDRFEIEDQDTVCGERRRFKMYFAKNGSLHLIFRTDGESSEKGFKILVTRMDCEAEERATEFTTTSENVDTSTMQLVPESTTLPFVPYHMPSSVPELPQCCLNTYNSKRFLLTSPDFPYSLNKRTKCSILIRKANDNVCRIRLNFLFFWLGTTNYNSCPYGSLKIDGKYVCGCNKELKLTTTFDSTNLKTLIYESGGYNLNSPSGFVLEVTQDECPKKYHPQLSSNEKNNSQIFKLEKGNINGLPWPRQEASIEQLQLVNEITNIVDDTSNYYQKNPRIVKTVYYFATPDYNPIPTSPQDIERTTFIDTESINSIVTNFNQFQCNNWNQMQFNLLNNRYGSNLQTCKRSEGKESNYNDNDANSRKNCVELDYLAGYFKSPGYPYYYPGGLNMCYRFKKQPGYCAIRLFMVDFKIENSVSCSKDYVLLGNYNRYCGKNLFGQSLTFDLTNKNHEDVKFVTDSFRCGRGFSGVYQQIACHRPSYPINPVNPTSTPIIPNMPTHSTRSPVCDRFVRERAFTLEVTGDEEICNFQIQKSSQYVCKINLYFEKFDLVCADESLSVDGMMFCGHLSGRKVSINVEGNEIKHLIYRSTLRNNYENLKLRIIGEQITDDCLYPEVPPERLVKFQNNLLRTDTTKHEQASKYLIAMHNKHLKEICGVITKSDILPENFCEILKHLHNATRCTILDNNYSYVPYHTNKLNLMNNETVMEVEYEETDCDSTVQK